MPYVADSAWQQHAKLPDEDLRRWLILHEMTHAWQFAAHPWLRRYMEESMRELIDKLTPVIDELYPDLDAELWRQHREILRQATLDSYSRARVNGTEPAAVIAARQAAYYITT